MTKGKVRFREMWLDFFQGVTLLSMMEDICFSELNIFPGTTHLGLLFQTEPHAFSDFFIQIAQLQMHN